MSALAAEPLPRRREAHEPPEARGLARDEVRLLVASRSDRALRHVRFHDLPRLLKPGDLVVVNTSRTLPAALVALRDDATRVELHLSTPAPGGVDRRWLVELRRGAERFRGGCDGETLELPGGAQARLLTRSTAGSRLWLADLDLPAPLEAYLARYGRPIRYRYVSREWPLDDYQTAYGVEDGSAEMPSAGRPFTPELVTALVARGIAVAPLVLHTGVSSQDVSEAPYAERYRVPPTTARLVNATRAWGGRVIAVGTTVVRALETVARPDSTLEPGAGWTTLVVTPERGVRAVDGLVTGWHEPDASHLLLLEAVGGADLVERSYRAAREHGYLWHEFGDSHLILP
jgi:S-adenosylmethionine:tRNA ribosyltransferase-isomerase